MATIGMADIRILIAVPHPLTADALSAIVGLGGFKVVGSPSLAGSVVSQAESLRPDIVLLDARLVEERDYLLRYLAKASPDSTVVVLTDGHSDIDTSQAAVVVDRGIEADSLIELLQQIAVQHQAPLPPPPVSPAELPQMPATRRKGLPEPLTLRAVKHAVALAVTLASFVPVAQMYLAAYPPAGIDFPFGVANVASLRKHFGLWVSLWDATLWSGDAFGRAYGILSSYPSYVLSVTS